MPEPPRRARFQIHLSTAIVMMFVAGGLLQLNLRERVELREEIGKLRPDGTFFYFYEMDLVRGWPLNFCTDDVSRGGLMNMTFVKLAQKQREFINRRDSWRLADSLFISWYQVNVAVDSAIALAILFAVWFILEWLIRRRSSTRKAG
ncbi:MAG TPA: hypothetical protein VKX17_11270 [Planctomycetota bacterium]|nr:hypothetical protein [Planctomycetota bacterium]